MTEHIDQPAAKCLRQLGDPAGGQRIGQHKVENSGKRTLPAIAEQR